MKDEIIEIIHVLIGLILCSGLIYAAVLIYKFSNSTIPIVSQVDCYDTCYPHKSMGYYAEKQQCYCDIAIELRSVK